MKKLLAIATVLPLSGCSLLFVDGPPRVRTPGEPVFCTDNSGWPTFDYVASAGHVVSGGLLVYALAEGGSAVEADGYVVGGALVVANGVGSITHLVSGLLGSKRVRDCRAAKLVQSRALRARDTVVSTINGGLAPPLANGDYILRDGASRFRPSPFQLAVGPSTPWTQPSTGLEDRESANPSIVCYGRETSRRAVEGVKGHRSIPTPGAGRPTVDPPTIMYGQGQQVVTLIGAESLHRTEPSVPWAPCSALVQAPRFRMAAKPPSR